MVALGQSDGFHGGSGLQGNTASSKAGGELPLNYLALEFTQAALPHTLLVNTVRKTFQEPGLRELDTTS